MNTAEWSTKQTKTTTTTTNCVYLGGRLGSERELEDIGRGKGTLVVLEHYA